MSIKDSAKSQDKLNQLSNLSPTKNKTKKILLKDVSNHDININTSVDSIKKEDQKINKQDSVINNKQNLQKTQKAELLKQKAEALKNLKSIQKQQKQMKVMIQKSMKKLPDIRQSPSNKQNMASNQQKKKQPLSVHIKTQADQPTKISQANQLSLQSSNGNYSMVNGRKVYMSEQDVVKLKKLKLDYRKREQQIKKKVVQHELLVQKMKTQQIITKQQRVQQQRRQRMKSIEQRQKILSKQRQQKYQRFQQQNKKLKQLKQSKKLYEKMQQEYNKIERKQKQQLNEMIRSRVGVSIVNFDQIKQHQRQYVQRKNENIQNSRIRIKSKIRQMQQQFNHLNLHKSQFYQKVKNQKKQILNQIQHNQRKRKVCSQKIKQYNQVVKQNYMPKVFRIQKHEQIKKHNLNLSQIHNLGNEYMKQGGKLIDRNKSLNLLQKYKRQQNEKTTKKTYKNYLHQNKTQSSPIHNNNKQRSSRSKQILMQKQLKQINTIKNPKQKYQKIKLLHNKIQKDLKSNIPSKIKLKSNKNYQNQNNIQTSKQVKQIQAKLQLLQSIDNHNL